MLKREAKKFVVDRGRSKYSPSVCQVLTVLISSVRIGGDKAINKVQIEDRLCVSKLDRIARVAQLTVRATQYALDILEKDGLITVHRENVRHTYTVHLTQEFQKLPYYKEKAMQAAAATKQVRKERKQRYEHKMRDNAELLRDFQETIRTEVDNRTPAEIRQAQLPKRWTLKQKINVPFVSAALPASKEFMEKLKRAEAAFDAKYPVTEAAAA